MKTKPAFAEALETILGESSKHQVFWANISIWLVSIDDVYFITNLPTSHWTDMKGNHWLWHECADDYNLMPDFAPVRVSKAALNLYEIWCAWGYPEDYDTLILALATA